MARNARHSDAPRDAITVEMYGELGRYIEKVADRALDLLLIIGRHGTGKSQRVKRTLGVNDGSSNRALYVEGHAQPFGIYRGLWTHRDQPVVFDDVDRLYTNPLCVRLLKPLCDTRSVKRVSWLTQTTFGGSGPPPSFETSSPVILIANEWRSANANVRALEDRAIIVHFDPPNSEVHREAGAWCVDREVYQFIEDHLSAVPAVSMRWYAKAQKLRAAGFDDWKSSMLRMMLPNLSFAAVAEVMAASCWANERERVAEFRRRTGQSRATYYRIKQRLVGPSGNGSTRCKQESIGP